MAVNPAAKDPNSFASTTMNGGAASTAILGVPQNPAMPKGPQPQGDPNAGSFGPQYWNTMSGTPPGGAQQPDYAAQVAAHNAQMLETMQAQYAPQQTQNTQTIYGLGPNNELQVGGTVVPMGDNPTMAAQLMQSPQAQQSITQQTLKPGFRPVTASDVSQYLSGINPGTWHGVKEVGKQFAGGALAGGLDTAGKAATWAGASGVGQSLQNAGAATDRFLGTDQPADTLGHGTVASGFINNARAAGLAVPVMAANVGLTAAGMPGAAAALGRSFRDAGPVVGLWEGPGLRDRS